MPEISTETSKAQIYVDQKAWNSKPSGAEQIAIESCPLCGHSNYKFYINVGGGAKDGLWTCFVCGEKGSLFQLRERLGDREYGLMSLQDMALSGQAPAALPDVAAAKRRLHNDPRYGEVLDYLVAERGYTMEVIESMGLGVEESFDKVWVVIPYFNKQGNLVYVKYRTVPPAKKEFRSSAGREAPLYNESVIVEGMDELIFVEGEADALSCMSNGIKNVVGVPGANMKKAAWITKLDNAAPKKIYTLYDRDKVGQQAAREMAIRLGIEKVFNIALPEFLKDDGTPGKDINEWFQAGHTPEDFEVLKQQARPFDVNGVQPLPAVIQELLDDIEKHGEKRAELDTPWEPLTERLGGANYGEVIGIIAEGKVGKTTMAMNWLDHYAVNGISGLNICLEMPQKALVRKWVSFKCQLDDNQLRKEHVQQALDAAKAYPADLLFGYTRVSKADDAFDLIRQAVRRYGVKVVVFDNLQFLARSIEHNAQEMSRYSKMFKELAMELNILILLIVQPNRVREGEIVSARNSNGSSAIEKDVDAMIALHRNRIGKVREGDFNGFLETEENFSPEMLVRVDLSRYAPGGVCTLLMDGAKSTVRTLRPDDFAKVKVEKQTTLTLPTEEPQAVAVEI